MKIQNKRRERKKEKIKKWKLLRLLFGLCGMKVIMIKIKEVKERNFHFNGFSHMIVKFFSSFFRFLCCICVWWFAEWSAVCISHKESAWNGFIILFSTLCIMFWRVFNLPSLKTTMGNASSLPPYPCIKIMFSLSRSQPLLRNQSRCVMSTLEREINGWEERED